MWLLSADWEDLARGGGAAHGFDGELERKYGAALRRAEARSREASDAARARSRLRSLVRWLLRREVGPERAPAIDVYRRWWGAVAAPERETPPRVAGDDGVDLFHDVLAERLDGRFFAMRDVLVTKGLDVDTIVVGPTGLWVFEVKFWSGLVACSDGRWRRSQSHFVAGGQRVVNDRELTERQRPDRQWQRECAAVIETVGGAYASRQARPAHPIRGGLVFTHPGCRWEIDDSAQAGYGAPTFWADQITGSPEVDGVGPPEHLRVLDALAARRRKLEPPSRRRSALRVAERLRDDVAAECEAYLERFADGPRTP